MMVRSGTRFVRFAVFFFLLMGCAGVSVKTAPEVGKPVAERPFLASGDSWSFTDRTETYTGMNEGLLVCDVSSSGKTITRYRTADLNIVKDVEKGKQIAPPPAEGNLLNFPLFVGKTWTVPAQDAPDQNVAREPPRYQVKAYENIKVKAGSFSAFKIEGSYRMPGKETPIVVRAWYAPEAKTVVKLEETIKTRSS